jgi:hypothetical protein
MAWEVRRMKGLFAHWKEISIVLSGVFAVLGLFWETKDKATGKITYWGRTFLTLTVVSIVGGLVAQMLEDSAERARSTAAQRDMLKLLTDINRLLQPVGQPDVFLLLKLDCELTEYEKFCEDARAKGQQHAKERNLSTGSGFEVEGADWALFPSSDPEVMLIFALFFQSGEEIEAFLKNSGCANCVETGDMTLNLSGVSSAPKKTIEVAYRVGSEEIDLALRIKVLRPRLNNKKLLSIPDLALSTLMLYDPIKSFKGLTPTYFALTTGNGQDLVFEDFRAQILQNQLFMSQFHEVESRSAPVFLSNAHRQ